MHCSILLAAVVVMVAVLASQAEADGKQRRIAPDPNGRRQLMVAIFCGTEQDKHAGKTPALYHNQYYDLDADAWLTDHDASAYCTENKQDILNYCRKTYPAHDIRNIVESSRQYKIDNWCRLGSKRKCRAKITVRPFRCLEGSFQSEALLVPEKCVFDHIHNKSACDNSDRWNSTAADGCQQKNMALQSYAVLNPCGLDLFSGVEFVCCPARQSKQHAAQSAARTGSKHALVDSDKFNEIAVDESHKNKHETKHEHDQKNKNAEDATSNDDSDDDDDEDDDDDDDDGGGGGADEDEYDDDSSSWDGSKPKSSTTSTTSTTTTTTTTTTTERPIDYYLSHFDLAHEHDDFRRAELAVENSYREKITNVMKEWSELEGRYQEIKKKNPEAAEDFKKKMAQRFEKTVESLEEEGAAERHQLISMHSERAMTIINRRKKAAMDCLTQALDSTPMTTKQVEKCIVRLIKALEKDRVHTLRQYKNLLNINTREALREKNTILEHLVTLNRAANQSIAMLDRSSSLSSKLKKKVVALWHNLRNIPMDEPIVRESELKIMEQYEEEVAQRKIEKERERLADHEAILEAPQESSTAQETPRHVDDKNGKQASSNPPAKPAATVLQPQSSHSSVSQHIARTSSPTQHTILNKQLSAGREDMDNAIHYNLDAAKYAHIKADSQHHELSYSIHREPVSNQLGIGYSAFLIFACTAIVIIALIGVRYYTRNATKVHRRRGFAEVGRSDPEEKNITNMQVNGYENPAYKLIEAEA